MKLLIRIGLIQSGSYQRGENGKRCKSLSKLNWFKVVKCAGVSPGALEFRKQKAKHTPTLHGVRHSLRSVDGALSVGLAHALAVRRSARVAAQLLVDRHVTADVLAHDRRDLYACQCTCMTRTGLIDNCYMIVYDMYQHVHATNIVFLYYSKWRRYHGEKNYV